MMRITGPSMLMSFYRFAKERCCDVRLRIHKKQRSTEKDSSTGMFTSTSVSCRLINSNSYGIVLLKFPNILLTHNLVNEQYLKWLYQPKQFMIGIEGWLGEIKVGSLGTITTVWIKERYHRIPHKLSVNSGWCR